MHRCHPRLSRRSALALGLGAALPGRRARAALPAITDALGRNVALKAPAERIVIDFNYEEFTAVAGPSGWDRVVGFNRTQWADNRAAVFRRYLVPVPRLAALADVGSTETNTFSMERLLSLRPDLVVLGYWSFVALPEQVKQMKALGIPVLVVDYNAEIPERHVASTLALGTLAWDGRAAPGSEKCGGVGYMPQDNAVRAALTAFEVVLLGRLRSLAFRVGDRDLLAAQAALAELGVADLAARRIGELSGGQRQLVFLAQVLAADPEALLLDEPTSALDIAHQLHVLGRLRDATVRRGLATVAVLHDLNAAARFADRIALMRAGRLVGLGRPADVCVLAGPDGHPVVLPLRPSQPGRISPGTGPPLAQP